MRLTFYLALSAMAFGFCFQGAIAETAILNHDESPNGKIAGSGSDSGSQEQRLGALEVGTGSIQFGDSVVSRGAQDAYIVCALSGVACATAKSVNEVKQIAQSQKAAALGAEADVSRQNIGDLLRALMKESADDYKGLSSESFNKALGGSPRDIKAKVAELVNFEEQFSSRLNKLMKSEMAAGLSDSAKHLLAGLAFGDRTRFVKEKLTGFLPNLDPKWHTMLSEKDGGYLARFAEKYRETIQREIAKADQAFSDVGCPACEIAVDVERLLPKMVATSGDAAGNQVGAGGRTQATAQASTPRAPEPVPADPKGVALTEDGKNFRLDGNKYEVRNENNTIKVFDAAGQPVKFENPNFSKLVKGYIDHINGVGRKATPAANGSPAAPKPAAEKAGWASQLKVTNDKVGLNYQSAIDEAFAKPTVREAARRLFIEGPFYNSHKAETDQFLARLDERRAGDLIREFLANRQSVMRHCPSCWLGERHGWSLQGK